MAAFAESLPQSLYTQAAVRAAELALVARGDVSLFGLVERAAAAAFGLLGEYQRRHAKTVIIAGKGNNGADALVLARLLLESGHSPIVCLLGEGKTAEHQAAEQQFIAAGGELTPFDSALLSDAELLVDGILGTGVSGELTSELKACIDAINASPAWVLSLDMPSGVNADTGNVEPVAVEADVTLCFGALKQGLFTSRARHFAGKIHFADLGFGPALALQPIAAKRVDAGYLTDLLGKRARDSHKGKSGKVTVMGGNYGMAGAVRLAGEACLRAGAGLVTVISRPEHQMTVNANRPELMFWGCELVDMEVYLRLGWADVLVLGPGLGKDDWGYNLYKAVGLSDKPCVLDADALNMLAKEPCKQPNRVLTPHPGEAARLLGISIADIEADRFDAVRRLHDLYGGVVLLKGAGTLIYDGESLVVAPVGNPGLASGGCGDVLSGIIAALMAQGLDTMTATVAGVVVHGEAADLAAKSGERGMLASDLMPFIRQLVNSDLI
ncbi:NAD(P)H-hydrate dehydratase [Shewanella sp. JM162201]|uniref:Bifunctional NAD(P)H-hydrate repair enzyme n=1 Tax=Shewanella jiangmenensis TaxID=2837387 RepID=A0ABS5V459_9GAMM|nr:NAD(P)H-hydrate dehydratase [Shewanella jiangmenensis]MBT1443848.1 NAD(P)H-hydrate dehydratase [Shewanella jiangmenensis]